MVSTTTAIVMEDSVLSDQVVAYQVDGLEAMPSDGTRAHTKVSAGPGYGVAAPLSDLSTFPGSPRPVGSGAGQLASCCDRSFGMSGVVSLRRSSGRRGVTDHTTAMSTGSGDNWRCSMLRNGGASHD
jgi:hypothetical protein